jgi:hypothetical protein
MLTFKENLRLSGFRAYANYFFLVLYVILFKLTVERDEEIDQRGGEGRIIRRRRMHGERDIRGTNIITGKATEHF